MTIDVSIRFFEEYVERLNEEEKEKKKQKKGTYIILLSYFYSSHQYEKETKRKTKAHSFSRSLLSHPSSTLL